MGLFRRFMSDEKVEKKYVNVGTEVGDAVSYSYFGECIGLGLMLNSLVDWEQEYVNRGYRTVPIYDFIQLGGYGKNLDSLLGQKLAKDEKPIFHAQNYIDKSFRKVEPKVDLNEMLNGNKKSQSGNYSLP